MPINRTARVFLYGAVLLVLAVTVAVFNVISLNEAYGGGPPYYSRTTNMDKWSSPLPVLVVVDVIAGLMIAACVFALLKRPSNPHE